MSRLTMFTVAVSLALAGRASAQEEPYHYERWLKVKNNTDVQLLVKVQYRTQAENGSWYWYPANPEQSDQAVTIPVGPGRAAWVADGDWYVHANRMRIWAEVPGTNLVYGEYKNQDQWLVGQRSDDGRRYYYSPEMGTFTFSFGMNHEQLADASRRDNGAPDDLMTVPQGAPGQPGQPGTAGASGGFAGGDRPFTSGGGGNTGQGATQYAQVTKNGKPVFKDGKPVMQGYNAQGQPVGPAYIQLGTQGGKAVYQNVNPNTLAFMGNPYIRSATANVKPSGSQQASGGGGNGYRPAPHTSGYQPSHPNNGYRPPSYPNNGYRPSYHPSNGYRPSYHPSNGYRPSMSGGGHGGGGGRRR